ncbi:hypothetical protein [Deinococcus hopiensis]|uniref:hypothetical protein n=1 Tax=Deinococcus hopiensis TaxID=309885 RepID=UPI00111C08CF|nr:hypothetical protein [Deinococcus hopiensis]
MLIPAVDHLIWYHGLTACMARVPASALKEAVRQVAVLVDKNANHQVEFVVADQRLVLLVEGKYG